MQSIEIRRQKATLNSTTEVDIVTAIAAGKSASVISVRVSNLDSAAVTAILKEGATEVDRVTGIPAGVCDKDSLCSRENPIHLQAGDSLVMVLAGAVAATQPVVRVAYLLATDSV